VSSPPETTARLSRQAGRIRVEVDVRVPPGSELPEQIRWLDSLPQADPDRLECEAFLYMTLARSAWRRADEVRRSRRRRPQAKAAAGE
jgi:hypothetical protein